MLCPEVWNFRAPDSSFKVDRRNNRQEIINKCYYNHLVSVILPDVVSVPQYLADTLISDCDYYKVSSFSVHEFVNKDFINWFVRKGSLTALSVGTRIDCEDCVTLTPKGQLVLSVNKETYQTLGLEGKSSYFCKNTKSRYLIHIDLTSNVMKPGKKFYERARKCLEKLDNIDILINWQPPNEDICPSSVARYFHKLNYKVKLCSPKYKEQTEYTMKTPVIDWENYDHCECYQFVEWLGMLSLHCDVECGSPNNYLNTFVTPEPNTTFGQVKLLQWTGFFTNMQIQELFAKIKMFIETGHKPWASLHVQGFSDSPISWENQEHHFYTNGDNSYIILLNPSGKSITCKQNCSHKYYK